MAEHRFAAVVASVMEVAVPHRGLQLVVGEMSRCGCTVVPVKARLLGTVAEFEAQQRKKGEGVAERMTYLRRFEDQRLNEFGFEGAWSERGHGLELVGE